MVSVRKKAVGEVFIAFQLFEFSIGKESSGFGFGFVNSTAVRRRLEAVICTAQYVQ